MPTISYPSGASLPGPWLVDAENLHQLDSLLDSICSKERERIESSTDAVVGSEHRKSPGKIREARGVTVSLSGGRTVDGERFADIQALASAMNERPTGFNAFLRVGGLTATVALRNNYSVDLSIQVTSDDDEISLAAFGRLRSWAADFEPTRWQRGWYKFTDFAGSMALILWPILFLGMVSTAVVDNPKVALKSEARQLLAQGVNASNSTRALELILAIESDYVPASQLPTYTIGARLWGIFICGMLVLICLRICPRMEIGLWAGKNRVKRWRWWMKTVSVSIPGVMFLYVILPWILKLLRMIPS